MTFLRTVPAPVCRQVLAVRERLTTYVTYMALEARVSDLVFSERSNSSKRLVTLITLVSLSTTVTQSVLPQIGGYIETLVTQITCKLFVSCMDQLVLF